MSSYFGDIDDFIVWFWNVFSKHLILFWMLSPLIVFQCCIVVFYECSSEEITFDLPGMRHESEAAKVFRGSAYYNNIVSGGINNTAVFLHSNNGSLHLDTKEYLQVKIILEMSEELLKYMSKHSIEGSGLQSKHNVFSYWKGIKRHCATILNDYYNQVAFKLWHTIKYKSKVLRGMGGGLCFENKTKKQILEHWYAEDNHVNSVMNDTVTCIRHFYRENFMTWTKGPYRVYAT